MMIPFWSDMPGGSHTREMEVDETTVPTGFVTGALGTTKRK